ncbi:CcdC protein domain-containing protein [Paenibacillus protaetiae]|uniref:DUF1453 family protein n=1 Tax=Paenibacillus protaetiae TaxID=2509456 RepID=A0A4P6EYG3_9BACL|nr:CcdC protein domain-containing protein [Paenibacillus protaetiae]QAY68124.1 DUF1453 family protein [Paenibacillus protaetiae]
MNHTGASIISFVAAAAIIGLIVWRRMGRNKRPVKGEGYGLLYPLAYIVIVFGLAVSQLVRLPEDKFEWPASWELLIAALLGVLFGTVMLYQTAYERRTDGHIYPKANKNLKYIFIGIIAIRIALTQYFSGMNTGEFSLLAMDMALVYIGIWRIGSFIKFRKVKNGPAARILS